MAPLVAPFIENSILSAFMRLRGKRSMSRDRAPRTVASVCSSPAPGGPSKDFFFLDGRAAGALQLSRHIFHFGGLMSIGGKLPTFLLPLESFFGGKKRLWLGGPLCRPRGPYRPSFPTRTDTGFANLHDLIMPGPSPPRFVVSLFPLPSLPISTPPDALFRSPQVPVSLRTSPRNPLPLLLSMVIKPDMCHAVPPTSSPVFPILSRKKPHPHNDFPHLVRRFLFGRNHCAT